MLMDYVAEVMGMLDANVFHTKVIDDEGEHDDTPLVLLEASGGIAMVVA